MYGQFSLATDLSSLLAYSNKSPRLILIYCRKLLRFMAIRVQLVILASAFVAGNTLVIFLFAPRCSVICKSGGPPPCPVVPDPLSGARPLGDGVGSGNLRDGSPSVWSRDKESPGMGSSGVWCPPFPAICKNGSTCPRALWSRRHCR